MRTFIGVALDPVLTLRLERELSRLRNLAPQARWVRAEGLHLTLAFLGEVPDAVVPAIGKGLLRVAATQPPLVLQAQGSGSFGPLDAPKVLWVGVSGQLERLQALQRAVVRELAPLGLAPDHEVFLPHITLARAKGPRGDPSLDRCAAALRSLQFGELAVREVALFASETTSQGMRYRPLVTGLLGAAAGTG